MAQEETKVKVTYDDLKPFIVEVGKKIHNMLVEAQKKHGNRYNNKNRYEELYKDSVIHAKTLKDSTMSTDLSCRRNQTFLQAFDIL